MHQKWSEPNHNNANLEHFLIQLQDQVTGNKEKDQLMAKEEEKEQMMAKEEEKEEHEVVSGSTFLLELCLT